MVEVVFPPVTRRGGNKKKSEMNGCLPIGLSGPTSHQPIRRPGEGWYWPRRCPPSSAAARHLLPAGEGILSLSRRERVAEGRTPPHPPLRGTFSQGEKVAEGGVRWLMQSCY